MEGVQEYWEKNRVYIIYTQRSGDIVHGPGPHKGGFNYQSQAKTGISENIQDISDFRKTAVINNELMTLNVDIATLRRLDWRIQGH